MVGSCGANLYVMQQLNAFIKTIVVRQTTDGYINSIHLQFNDDAIKFVYKMGNKKPVETEIELTFEFKQGE